MIVSSRTYVLLSIAVGIYALLVVVFFNPAFFFESRINVLDYILVFGVASVSFLVINKTAARVFKERVRQLCFAFSFILSLFLASLILWMTNIKSDASFFLFTSSFLISGMLPAIGVSVWFIFESVKGKLTVGEGGQSSSGQDPIFSLKNKKGRAIFEVEYKRIICFEASDNYVITHYLTEDNKQKKSMDRLSLKQIEKMLDAENVIFFRVHKSFIVNASYIKGIGGKSQAYKLKLNRFESEVPVSRSFDINRLPTQPFA